MITFTQIPVRQEHLAATLHMPDPAAGRVPVVVCCHGLTGSRIGTCYRFVRLARRLAAENIGCLRFDFRGCGESEGEFESLTADRLVEDLLAVLSEVTRLPRCDSARIGIVGSSFGAFTTSLASDRINGLRGTVFWAPVAYPRRIIEQELTEPARALLRQQGWLEHHGHRLRAAFFDEMPDIDAPAKLANRRKPLLIYHGTGDRQVPFEHGLAFKTAQSNAGATVKLHELALDDHGMRTVDANETILDGSVAWLRRHLQSPV
ncbi:MAG: alpha/beta fold hydrolase [Planctomycetota bacterium]|nr:alpha/beta fold hydrolase [Planctomycetota bacterium]